MNLAKTVTLALVTGMSVSGCMFDKRVKAPTLSAHNAYGAYLPQPAPVRSAYTRPVPVSRIPAPAGIRAGSDLIAAQDKLEITVFKVPDLTRELRVGTDGMITFPLVGQIRASGLRPAQLEQAIARKLAATYMKDPQVTVVVKESVQNRVTVEGAVKKPGVFPVIGSMTVLQAVAMAEGFTANADASGAVLLRKSSSGQISQQAIDIAAIRQGRMQDLLLLQDDRLFIPEATYKRFTVAGEVNSPGLFELRDGMTILQAVAMAGGMTRLADKKQALLFRRDDSGNFRRFKVNLQAIFEGRAADPYVDMDDRVVVLNSRTKTFLDEATRYITPPSLW